MNTASLAAQRGASARVAHAPGRPTPAPASSARALRLAATAWCSVAVLGQIVFACYLAALYGMTGLRGRLDLWRTVMPHGYAPQTPVHNSMIALHLLFALLLVSAGALQLLPLVRRRWPRLHRWNGRAYVVAAIIGSLTGLAMVWTPPGTVGDIWQHLGVSLNAVLILAAVVMAWRAALQGRFDIHRRWALRLYLLVGGVWFFRLGLMLWLLANRGPAGFDPETFTGPALTTLSFGQSLLPLALLQLYFIVQQRGSAAGQWAMATTLGLLSLLTAAGVAAATAMMWLPPVLKVLGPKGMALFS